MKDNQEKLILGLGERGYPLDRCNYFFVLFCFGGGK